MPNVQANGISLYYEIHPAKNPDADPTPLLMIMGLGLNSMSWHKNLPGLNANHTVIIFDNRGTGRSSKPDAPYSVRQMADDTAGLLDALKVRRAHIFGYSMGGMIAQEFAINYPQKVKSLILGGTTPGGIFATLPSLRVGNAMLQRGNSRTPSHDEPLAEVLYSREFIKNHPEEIAKDSTVRLVYPTPAYAYRHQLGACMRHHTYNRLDQLQMPTLVFAATADKLVPPQNSRLLARRIPRAELVLLPGYGHFLPSENPAAVAQVINNFLSRNFVVKAGAKAA